MRSYLDTRGKAFGGRTGAAPYSSFGEVPENFAAYPASTIINHPFAEMNS